ncbi:MAG: alpha/beta hydrolase [Candidatus Marinimicrobia bacterium]|nr:alpha/beta hydrolase [Candidatus Neomarinimicrobiota bacterium]
MKFSLKIVLIIFFTLFVQNSPAQDIYKLWEGEEKPYYKENDLQEYKKEVWGDTCVYNVTEPTLTVYNAKGENSGKAVIICPGGGYSCEAIYHEGYDIADALAQEGITAAVLKYRLPTPKSSNRPHLVPLSDARKALKLLREKRDEYGFAKNKVGIIGFSAGGHLANITTLWPSDDPDERPNFSAPIYGVSRPTEENLQWLGESLYYRELTKAEMAKNNLLDQVSKTTPPVFLVHAQDDTVCNVKESTAYAQELFKHDVPVEMHIFQKGGHGFGFGHSADGTDKWLELFVNFLKLDI